MLDETTPGLMVRYLIRKISVYSTVGYFYLRRMIKQHPALRKKWTYDKKAGIAFERFIKEIPSDKVFVHVSLSAVRSFTPGPDVYNYLRNLLQDRFSLVVSQAFTPKVRKTKVFDPEREIPAYGAFARQFFRESQFRNHDPCYSVMARGACDFKKGDLSFSRGAVFRQMADQNFYCLNIGLDFVTCSLIHLVEYEQRVPYLDFYDDEYIIREKGQDTLLSYPIHANRPAYSVKGFVWWNKIRLKRDLAKTRIVRTHKAGGVLLYAFSMLELYHFVTEKVKADPYYLIKW